MLKKHHKKVNFLCFLDLCPHSCQCSAIVLVVANPVSIAAKGQTELLAPNTFFFLIHF